MQRLSVGLVALQGIVVVLALSWAVPSSAEPLSIDSLQQKPAAQKEIPELVSAQEKLRKGDVEGALADMKAAAAKHPNLSPGETMMAHIYSRTNRPSTVRYWLERAVVESPDDPEAYAMLGQDALQNKRIAEARLLFKKTYELLANYNGDENRKKQLQALTFRQLAALAMGRKEWPMATGYLDELLKLRPDDKDALQLLARVLFEEGKPEEAIEKLKAAKLTDVEMLTPEAMVAQWYEGADDRDNAIKYMTAALKKAGRDYKTRFVAADWAFKAQSFDQARTQADAALKLAGMQDINPSPALTLAGSIAIFQGDYPTAEKYLLEAVAKSPATFPASNNLALALCEQDNEDKQKLALQYAKINAALYPQDSNYYIEALSTLGRVLFRLGDYKEADAVFRKVISTGRPLSPDTVYYIADLYAATDRRDDAKKLLASVEKKEGLFSQRENAKKLLEKLGQ